MVATPANAVNIKSAAGIMKWDGTASVSTTAITQYNTLVGGASNAITSIAPSATAGVPLVSGGASANPSFTTAVVAGGGTGVATMTTAYAPVCAGTTATGALQVASTGLASSGFALTSNGSAALPSFQGVANSITGTANEVLVNGSSGSTLSGDIILTTPQAIGTASIVQFGKLGLAVVASNNTLSITGKASIGYGDTAAPTSGLIVSGAVGIGTSSLSGYFSVGPTAVTAYNYMSLISGTIVGNSSSSPVYGESISLTIQPNYAGTIANCNTYNIAPSFSPATGCTITTAYGMYISAGAQAGLGAVTNGIGLRVLAAAYGTTKYTAYFDVGVGVGGLPPVTAALSVTSTTLGFLPPRMTTTQKAAISAPTAGLIVYDATLAKLCVYTTAWQTITSV